MAPKPLTFRARDVTQALLAARKANLPVSRLEIDKDGKIVVHMGSPAAASVGGNDNGDNECDAILDRMEAGLKGR